MNLLPIELYLILLAVIPLGVCFAKWNYELTWKVAFILCAVSSWVYFNLWMGKLDPPNNGFANFVYIVTGWFWLLPIFAIFYAIFRLFEKWVSPTRISTASKVGFIICSSITAGIVLWNLIGRMSAERAIIQARQELESRGYEIIGREIPQFEGSNWSVRYPDSDFGEIRLSRNGRMMWIGSP